MRDTGLNTWTTLASAEPERGVVALPSDALANPSNDDLISAGLMFWPQGAAWGSPDGEAVSLSSVLARFTRVLLEPFVSLYARAFGLTMESTLSGVVDTLDAWEEEHGLPDNCGLAEDSVSKRLMALEEKVMGLQWVTPGDFIRLAARYGFTISIEEPAIFECGFSECGSEHVVGDVRQEAFWIVYIDGLSISYFRCAESECGYDPLFSLDEAERVLCLLRRMAPAWTLPVLGDLEDLEGPREALAPIWFGSRVLSRSI